MSDKDLIRLRRQRGWCKRRVTDLQGYIDNAEARGLIEEFVIADIEVRLIKVELCFDEFYKIQLEIEDIDSVVEVEEETERRNFEYDYYKVTSAARILINRINKQISPTLDSSTADVSRLNTSNSREPVAESRPIALPKLSLPTFAGSFDEWLEFRDSFLSLIHTNASLSDIQRFHYLRTSLRGEAALVLKSFDLQEDTYQPAWKCLCERYNNDRLLIKNHLQLLFNLPIIQRESCSELRLLLDNITKHMSALKSLKQPTDQWDVIVIFIIVSKLENNSTREWETLCQRTPKIGDKLEELLKFLADRAKLLETIESTSRGSDTNRVLNNKVEQSRTRSTKGSFVVANVRCSFCSENHFVANCTVLLSLSVEDRIEQIKSKRLCFNCLRGGHSVAMCHSSSCRQCGKRHHSLLHLNRNSNNVQSSSGKSNAENVNVNISIPTTSSEIIENIQNVPTVSCQGSIVTDNVHTLLPTAVVYVKDVNNCMHPARVLLDSGSQSNFVRADLIKQLRLRTNPYSVQLCGIGLSETQLNASCAIEVFNYNKTYSFTTTCLVIPDITGFLPSYTIHKPVVPETITLADPHFHVSQQVDLLLGSEIFWTLLGSNQSSLGPRGPIIRETKLGWIIAGNVPLPGDKRNEIRTVAQLAFTDVQQQLSKFWEIEEINEGQIKTNESIFVENHFSETVKRSACGRFIVNIPLCGDPRQLGDSYQTSLRRLHSLERRLQRNQQLSKQYTKFMREYIELDHMTEVNEFELEQFPFKYYIPHHAVTNLNSSTTKLRVVFDASAATSNGKSFNNIQFVGPALQENLASLLVRFRQHRYALTADIQKMYRQIIVDEEQRSLQLVLWRETATEQVRTYKLNTVTYGTASAPYLSIRCLHQLANEIQKQQPRIANIIKNDFYVDDVLTGGDSVEEAQNIVHCLTKVLNTACFPLHKWACNSSAVVINKQPELSHQIGTCEASKTLGLLWLPTEDQLGFNISDINIPNRLTKRVLLSVISQIFDPLGLIAPVIIKVKIILQQLWLEKLSWDDSIPTEIAKSWYDFYQNINQLKQIRVPRHAMLANYEYLQIHGFSDASEKAFGACVYIVSRNQSVVESRLLVAKSRVAPLKVLTIPRLELCAAVLLVKLIKFVNQSLTINANEIYLWTDSSIVLGWLKTNPSNLKTFVAHRIASIQTALPNAVWNHVKTDDNPADLLSRGINPISIVDLDFWWRGPEWLRERGNPHTNASLIPTGTLPELRVQTFTSQDKSSATGIIDFNKFSNLTKLERVLSIASRFIFNCKHPIKQRRVGCVTVSENQDSLLKLAKIAQLESYNREILNLKANREVSSKSSILSLAPFIDEHGLLRVGGRLRETNLQGFERHPILIAHDHPLASMIMTREHLRLLHVGPLGLLNAVRSTFWIVSGRRLARKVVHSCMKCFRANPQPLNPPMGNLPSERVSPSSPFTNCGVDYAGPVTLKTFNGRGCKTYKSYIGLFVCFSTRALHLELISSLTTEAFLAALRRFVSRRGLPSNIYSDNGTNFVGAARELTEFLELEGSKLIENATKHSINWHFSPPRAPNFGGLWEAGVRSVKHHIKRVIGEQILTYEDFSTFLAQIEAILNSRPLSPLSSDPNDISPLTPSHFLIGRTMTCVPDANMCQIPESRLGHFQRLQSLQQHFWHRWSSEYLHQLQQRPRSKQGTMGKPIEVGSLVVLKDNAMPPMAWQLGRITKVHPGKDGVIRVVTVRTTNGELQRPTSKICPLPSGVQPPGHTST